MAKLTPQERLTTALAESFTKEFYETPAKQRRAYWDRINNLMDACLEDIVEHKGLPHTSKESLVWKLQQLRNEENAYLITRYVLRVREGWNFTQLDNSLEDLQMGFGYDQSEWRWCSAIIGVVTANYRAGDRQQTTYYNYSTKREEDIFPSSSK